MQHKEATEKALLGCLISNLDNRDSLYTYLPDIKCEYFTDEQNRQLFEILNNRIILGDPLDIIILSKEYKAKHGVDAYNYITQLSDDSFEHHLIHISEYIKYLSELTRRRKLFKLGNYLINKAKSEDIGSMLNTTESSIIDIQKEQTDSTLSAIQVSQIALKRINNAMDRHCSDGLETGYNKLDGLLGGIEKNNLVVIAARPGIGKTTLALNMCLNLSKHNKCGLIFTYEMSPEELSIKMLSAISNIEQSKIKYGNLHGTEFQIVMEQVNKLSSYKFYMNSSYPTLSEIKSIAINTNIKDKLDYIIIDYIQLVKPDKGIKFYSRDQEIGVITRGLKEATLKLGIPIIILAQLNRAVDKRESNKPTLSDLRESGNIEQDADKVVFLYENEQGVNTTMVYVAKNRQGEVGETQLHFRKECSAFYEK